MDLISKTTITNDEKYPKPKDYVLTLKIHLTKFDGNGLHPALGAMLNNVLHDWRDGRHPFFVEQMHEGLERTFRNAVYACIQRDCQEVYGKEMVALSETHSKSRWAIEADKLMAEFDMPYIRDNWEASIERDPPLTREDIAKMLAAGDKETERILGMSDEELAS